VQRAQLGRVVVLGAGQLVTRSAVRYVLCRAKGVDLLISTWP